MSSFPYYCFAGPARTRGLACGEALAARIRTTFAFYRERLFARHPLGESGLTERAARVRRIVYGFDTAICEELDAIAEAAGVPQWQIYLLNARTEILNAAVGECTALAFPGSKLLGQTWDWFEGFDELAVLVRYEMPDGTVLLAFTEPGMLAKIGLNNHGLGVCLNFLEHPHALDGVPVHILIRAILGCRTVAHARQLIDAAGLGKSSHLLVADAAGAVLSTEFLGDRVAEGEPVGDAYLHTNHCLTGDERADDGTSTFKRYARSHSRLTASDERSLGFMRSLLEDDSDGDLAVNSAFHPSVTFPGERIGTCGMFLMDLARREMHVRKGPGIDNPLEVHSIEEPAAGR